MEKLYFKLGKKLKFLPTSPLFDLMHTLHLDKTYLKIKFSKYLQDYSEGITEIVNYSMNNYRKIQPGIAPYELEFMIKKIDETKKINGDILELGTHKGGTSILFAKYLQKINDSRMVFTVDWFKGLPYSDEYGTTEEKKPAQNRLADTSKDFVENKFRSFNVSEKINIVEGLFEDVLYEKLDNKKFSFVFIDCDLYKSAKFALEYVYEHLDECGIVCIHDYSNYMNRPKYDWGIIKATNEFKEKYNIKFEENPLAHFTK